MNAIVPENSQRELLETMSEQQILFARNIAAGKNHTQSARLAGYAHPNVKAPVLLKNKKIQALIESYQQQVERDSRMTRKKVMDGFLEAIDMAKIQGETATMVAGWREISKMCGYYAPEKKKIDLNITAKRAIDQLETMSDSELARMIEDGTSVIEGEAEEVLDGLDAPQS